MQDEFQDSKDSKEVKKIVHDKENNRFKEYPLSFLTKHPQISLLIRISLAKIDCLYPNEWNLETGKVVKELSQFPDGITRNELAEIHYSKFFSGSFQYRESCEMSLAKLIQRASFRFLKYGITIKFCRRSKKWYLIPVENPNYFNKKDPFTHLFSILNSNKNSNK